MISSELYEYIDYKTSKNRWKKTVVYIVLNCTLNLDINNQVGFYFQPPQEIAIIICILWSMLLLTPDHLQADHFIFSLSAVAKSVLTIFYIYIWKNGSEQVSEN